MFVYRFDGQVWPEQYRFDGRRGRWMEFVSRRETLWAGQWRPAQTILDAAGGLIATPCGDSASDASRWGKLAVYKDVLALAREHLTIDQWDAWGEVSGAPQWRHMVFGERVGRAEYPALADHQADRSGPRRISEPKNLSALLCVSLA